MYYLNHHIYAREFDAGAVLLDARSGRYLGIDAASLPALRATVANWPVSEEIHIRSDAVQAQKIEELLATLLARGIFTTAAMRQRTASPAAPCLSLLTAS